MRAAKALESFDLRLPVVNTSAGVEALPVSDERECRIDDEPRDCARALLALLDDRESASPTALSAWVFVAEHSTWDAAGDALNRIRRGRPEAVCRAIDAKPFLGPRVPSKRIGGR